MNPMRTVIIAGLLLALTALPNAAASDEDAFGPSYSLESCIDTLLADGCRDDVGSSDQLLAERLIEEAAECATEGAFDTTECVNP